jgi:hypothetical protein
MLEVPPCNYGLGEARMSDSMGEGPARHDRKERP